MIGVGKLAPTVDGEAMRARLALPEVPNSRESSKESPRERHTARVVVETYRNTTVSAVSNLQGANATANKSTSRIQFFVFKVAGPLIGDYFFARQSSLPLRFERSVFTVHLHADLVLPDEFGLIAR